MGSVARDSELTMICEVYYIYYVRKYLILGLKVLDFWGSRLIRFQVSGL